MSALMAIDPGLQGTGYAIWNTNKKTAPYRVGVLNGGKGDWQTRVDRIALAIRKLCREENVDRIICEMMEHYNTASSQMAWSKGDLQRTMFLIGTLHGVTRKQVPYFRLVTPREWKGQLPKSVTIQRVEKALTAKQCRNLGIKTHAWDAVGIGLWHLGVIE